MLEGLLTVLLIVAQSLLLIVALLVYIAYALYADRKIWAAVQLRRGPNVVGPWGLFQSFADLLKFVLKEPVIPASANKVMFLLAPLVMVTLALAAWAAGRRTRSTRSSGPCARPRRWSPTRSPSAS